MTVKDAYYARGYSSDNGPLDDTEFKPLIGRAFRSVEEAMAEAIQLETETAPIVLKVECADGTTRTVQEYD